MKEGIADRMETNRNGYDLTDGDIDIAENSKCALQRHSKRFSYINYRLNTFHNWKPSVNMWPKHLAEAGYILVNGNIIQCYECASILEVGSMHGINDPLEIHHRNSPSCKFIRIQKLKKENEDLRNSFKCFQCRQRHLSYVLIPCSHVACDKCYVTNVCLCRTLVEHRHAVVLIATNIL
ncbi:Hypothetical predicted protein [Mytilus galloprovincialis]|uniref:Uncharacterized protein n=1 Tax=Mytilus galloprovincialis TaxID=29158 RepID=A0A8B6FDM9_MYTGA|nr:Hypothetical predicted protein [Mytilus galloprovincialis]